MKRLLACLLLAAALVTNACALEVPTDTTVQNLNGSQQLIKTYTLPPGVDPQTLIEDPFELSSPVIKCKKTPRKKCRFVAEVKGKR